jgi:hypothetical protein
VATAGFVGASTTGCGVADGVTVGSVVVNELGGVAAGGATVVEGSATGDGTAIATLLVVSTPTLGSRGFTEAGVLVTAFCVGAAGNAGASATGVGGGVVVESAVLSSFLPFAMALPAVASVVTGELALSKGGGAGRLFPTAAGCWRIGSLPIGTEEGATIVGFVGFTIGATGCRGGTVDGLTAATLAEGD